MPSRSGHFSHPRPSLSPSFKTKLISHPRPSLSTRLTFTHGLLFAARCVFSSHPKVRVPALYLSACIVAGPRAACILLINCNWTVFCQANEMLSADSLSQSSPDSLSRSSLDSPSYHSPGTSAEYNCEDEHEAELGFDPELIPAGQGSRSVSIAAEWSLGHALPYLSLPHSFSLNINRPLAISGCLLTGTTVSRADWF